MQELLVIEKLTPAIFTNKGIDPLLEDIKKRVADFKPDISTDDGRQEIKSFAYKIARSKTALDDMGKELVSEWKSKSKLVDAERKRVRDAMDEMRDAVRKPLTDWEDAEKERIAVHVGNMAEIANAGLVSWQVMCIDALKDRLINNGIPGQ